MDMDLNKARAEIREKPKRQIEGETANTWTARAIAAWERVAQARAGCARCKLPVQIDQIMQYIAEAAAYEHEAIEHAAEAGADRYVAVRRAIEAAKVELGLGEP